jgi:hypothetical protein
MAWFMAVAVDEVGVGFQVADERVGFGEGQVALFARLRRLAKERPDVAQTPQAAGQGLGAGGIDGGARVLFAQVAQAHDASQRFERG